MSAKTRRLDEIIRPVVEGLGYELWGIEYTAQGKHSMLRVFIEKELSAQEKEQDALGEEITEAKEEQAQAEQLSKQVERESGIELADCEKVSRQLSGVLDVEDPITSDYTLEVSSPGMDRPLYTLAHYERFKGHRVDLKLRMPFEGRRKYSGLLAGVEGHDVVIQVEQEEYLFPLEGIDKANIVPQFD